MRLFALLLLLCFFSALARAEDVRIDLSAFSRLPVAADGRVQPLESFARRMLVQLKGDGNGATGWLAEMLFNPAGAAGQRCFRVDNAHVRAMLGLEQRTDKIYTLAELVVGLDRTADEAEAIARREQAQWTADEAALFALHNNVLQYGQLISSLSLVLPLPTPVPAALLSSLPVRPAATLSYLDAIRAEPLALEQVKSFIDRATPENMSPEQQQLGGFVMTLQKLRDGGSRNQLLRVVPSSWHNDWLSPWAIVLSGQGAPQTAALLGQWQTLALAYQAQDAQGFASLSQALLAATLKAQPDASLAGRLEAEIFYYHLHPYAVAATLFVLAGLLALRRRAGAGWGILLLASLVLAAALATRIYILQRPPVGTLYESALFVALVIAMVTLAASLKSRVAALIAGGGFAAAALITVAPALVSGGESLSVLSAVLNTNFWLTIHVLCITAGYGACLATALLAHALLYKPNARYEALMHTLSLVALLLTATGTLLGGIWADQSWGRFWGWDPKENGALLIVLWLLWLLHGRIASQLSPRAVTAGMAALAVVVAQAWFGVNLLGIGLHSYGFITGIALALFGFTALDLALIAALWLRAARKAGPHAPA